MSDDRAASPAELARWMKAAPPYLVARVRVLGVVFALNRWIETAEREAAAVRSRALRSDELSRRRPCDRCSGRGYLVVVEPSPDGGDWSRWASDCGTCRARRLFLRCELAAAKLRALELEALADACSALTREILPEVEKVLAWSRREEWEAEREREREQARAVTRNLSRNG